MIDTAALEELVKEIKEEEPEMRKLINKALHTFGLTKEENYEGWYAIAAILSSQYVEAKGLSQEDLNIVSLFKDIRTFIRAMILFTTTAIKYMGMLDEGVIDIVKGIEGIGSWIEKL